MCGRLTYGPDWSPSVSVASVERLVAGGDTFAKRARGGRGEPHGWIWLAWGRARYDQCVG
jgi:hypothetical protein